MSNHIDLKVIRPINVKNDTFLNNLSSVMMSYINHSHIYIYI